MSAQVIPMPMRDAPVTSFPRKDNAFKAKSSLDFDMMRSKIYLER